MDFRQQIQAMFAWLHIVATHEVSSAEEYIELTKTTLRQIDSMGQRCTCGNKSECDGPKLRQVLTEITLIQYANHLRIYQLSEICNSNKTVEDELLRIDLLYNIRPTISP